MITTPLSTRAGLQWPGLLLAILCAAGMWTYANRVLIPYQIAEAEAHHRLRGNPSDLYPRWFGARELLLHGRDPYSADVTRDIQQGYYGRPLDPTRPGGPTDQERFAYPVYVAFFLAPTIHQSFAVVKEEVFWILLVLTIASVLLWLRVLHWRLPALVQLAFVILTLGALPVVQALKLDQLTLLVAALLAVAVWLLARDRLIAAGVALALATIKPQLVSIFLLWLVVWTLSGWRRRFRWLVSFLLTLAALFAASEHYLPHWLPRFMSAVHDYRTYTDAVPLFSKLLPAPWSALPWLLAAAATAYAAWNHRSSDAKTPEFDGMAALMLAVTVIVIPTYALYNQVLLLPALLWLTRESPALWQGSWIRRGLLLLTSALLLWPWVTAVILSSASFMFPQEKVEKAWVFPFWTALLLPLGVAALMLVAQFRKPFAAYETTDAS